MTLFESTRLIFQELYAQATVRSGYIFKPKPMHVRAMVKFVKWIEKTYPTQCNVDFLVRYFEFQFARYAGIKTQRRGVFNGVNTIMIGWLIGEKAQEHWELRDIKRNVIVKYKVRKEVHLNLKKAFRNEQKKENIAHIKKMYGAVPLYEDGFKSRFYNTEEGLVWCWQNTTLHHPASELCKGCDNAPNCIKLQEKHYPLIFKIRKANG